MAKKRNRGNEGVERHSPSGGGADEEIQRNTCQRLSGIDSNTSPNTIGDLPDEGSNRDAKMVKKRGRGASKLKLGSGQQKPKEVERNDYGQPIGKTSIKYSSFLGCLVKEFVPYTVDKWENVEDPVLDKMWDCLKMTYNVQDGEKKTILQKLDKLWRDGKSRLQRSVRLAMTSNLASRDLALLKPQHLDKDQWDFFVKRTLSNEFQEKSQKFQAMKANQNMPHTTSRRGFARLRDKMTKQSPAGIEVSRGDVWIKGHTKTNGEPSSQAVAEKIKLIQACSAEKRTTTDIANDAIKEVFGDEARGRVRGMGFGVTPSKVGAQVQQNQTIKELKSQVYSLGEEMKLMQSMISQVLKQQNMQEQVGKVGMTNVNENEVAGGINDNGAKETGGSTDKMNRISTSQANNENVNHGHIPENARCKLFHWDFEGAVAEGRIASIDPKAKVHHVVLGKSFWKIWVDKVLVENVDLIRPNDENGGSWRCNWKHNSLVV